MKDWEKKKAASERFKTNQWFDSDEGSFYKHLTNIVKATEKTANPSSKAEMECLEEKIQQ